MFKPLITAAAALALIACSEESMRPQPQQPPPQAPQSAEVAAAPEVEPVPKHNLSRVADAKGVTAEQLEALEVGKTTEQQVLDLLGETKPFFLGDGKHILRYDVGKFIFDQNKILIRKFLSH